MIQFKSVAEQFLWSSEHDATLTDSATYIFLKFYNRLRKCNCILNFFFHDGLKVWVPRNKNAKTKFVNSESETFFDRMWYIAACLAQTLQNSNSAIEINTNFCGEICDRPILSKKSELLRIAQNKQDFA